MTNIYNMVLACLLVLASKLLSICLPLRYHSLPLRYLCATLTYDKCTSQGAFIVELFVYV